MKIIGIAGKMHCGKTTLAGYLADHLKGDTTIVNFGDILKREVAEKYNFPLDWCYSQSGKDNIIVIEDRAVTVRYALQWYGTDLMRAKDVDYWVKKMATMLGKIPYDTTVIIADIRFPNEVDFIGSTHGKCIRLRPYPEWDKMSDHESEIALDNHESFWLDIAPPFGSLKPTAAYITVLLEEAEHE